MAEIYRVEPNKWGGFYVVDRLGNLAPRPHGFNQRESAELRVMRLNESTADTSPSSQAPKEA